MEPCLVSVHFTLAAYPYSTDRYILFSFLFFSFRLPLSAFTVFVQISPPCTPVSILQVLSRALEPGVETGALEIFPRLGFGSPSPTTPHLFGLFASFCPVETLAQYPYLQLIFSFIFLLPPWFLFCSSSFHLRLFPPVTNPTWIVYNHPARLI